MRLLWHDCVWYFCGKMGIKGNQIVLHSVLHENTKNKTQSRFLQGHSSLSGSQGLSRSLMVSPGLSWSLTGSLKVSHAFSGSLRGFHTRFLKVSHRISRRFSGSLNEMTQKVSHKGSRKSCIKVSKCVFLKISQVSSHGCSTHHISGFQVLPQFDSRCHGHHMFQNRYQQNHMRSFDCRNIDAQSCERLVIKTNVGAVIRFCHHSHSQHTGSMCETSLRERCVSFKNLMFARQHQRS